MHDFLVALFAVLVFCHMTGAANVSLASMFAPLIIDVCLGIIVARHSKKVVMHEISRELMEELLQDEHDEND